MTSLIRILLATLILCVSCPAEEAQLPTASVPVAYLDVIDAYQRLKSSFPEIHEIVRTVQIDKSTLVLNPAHAKYDAARQMLKRIDVRPKQVLLRVVVSELAQDGSEKIISRPNLTTLNNQPAAVIFSSENKQFKVSINPTVLPEAAAK
ncbi:hypothetical protein [Prosthecobacter sp.]|uniref:hypothetical protein n=1 Tax=Prosthecobacter sp. TaxID=1965333 RepID=UPI003783541D